MKAIKYGQEEKRKTMRVGKFCCLVWKCWNCNTNFKLSNKLLAVLKKFLLFTATTRKAAKTMKLISYMVPAKQKPLLTKFNVLETCSFFSFLRFYKNSCRTRVHTILL